jgi:hypothetical protein
MEQGIELETRLERCRGDPIGENTPGKKKIMKGLKGLKGLSDES